MDGAGRRIDGNPNANASARAFAGNSIKISNRNVQFANQNYQPAYSRHPSFYRGYWNGNRSYGPGAVAGSYGAGYRGGNYGYGPLYGNGWGYGYGNQAGNQGGFGNQSGIGMTLAQLGLGLLGGGGGSGLGGGFGSGGGYSPVGWGLGGWGLGSMAYGSGYLPYSNPYYAGGAGANSVYNYAQPIPVSYNTVVVFDDRGTNTADSVLNQAIAAFQANDYDKALDIVDQGIQQFPDDSVLHEFRALTLFARQDFQQSAATIHSVLAVGPGWNWTTMSGLYGDVGLYTIQLRALEAYTKTNPQDSASRFLLAYHYMVGGHNDAVARQLGQVVKLTPTDYVAADLLRMVSAPIPATVKAGDPIQAPGQLAERTPAKVVDPSVLVGSWHASRAGGDNFSLVLDKDSNFKWTYAQGSNPAAEFDGKYTMEGNVLALERKDGGSLIAQIEPDANGSFNFKLVGAPTEDPGLSFAE